MMLGNDVLSPRQEYWLDSWSEPSIAKLEELQKPERWNQLSAYDKEFFTRYIKLRKQNLKVEDAETPKEYYLDFSSDPAGVWRHGHAPE